MVGACSTHVSAEKCAQNFGRKPEERKPLEIIRCRWEDNIRMYLMETGCEYMNWIHLA